MDDGLQLTLLAPPFETEYEDWPVIYVNDQCQIHYSAADNLVVKSQSSYVSAVVELSIMLGYQHPNIQPASGYGVGNRISCFMPAAEQALDSYLRGSLEESGLITSWEAIWIHGHTIYPPTQLDRISGYLRQLLSGLDFLHSNGILHGDLKPENILLYPDYQLKISDFGASRLMLTNEPQPLERIRCSARYVDLEVASADKERKVEYSYPSDLWSFALIVLEFYGRCPVLGRIDDPYPKAYRTSRQKQERILESGKYLHHLPEQHRDLIKRLLGPSISRPSIEECLKVLC